MNKMTSLSDCSSLGNSTSLSEILSQKNPVYTVQDQAAEEDGESTGFFLIWTKKLLNKHAKCELLSHKWWTSLLLWM